MSRLRRPAASGFAIRCYSLAPGKLLPVPGRAPGCDRFRRKFPPPEQRISRGVTANPRRGSENAILPRPPVGKRHGYRYHHAAYNMNLTISRPPPEIRARIEGSRRLGIPGREVCSLNNVKRVRIDVQIFLL